MADEVIIGGYSKEAIQSLPEWAKEATQESILNVAKQENAKLGAAVQFLSKIAMGQQVSKGVADGILKSIKDSDASTKKGFEKLKQSNDKPADAIDEQTALMKKYNVDWINKLGAVVGELTGIREELDQNAKQAARAREDMLDALNRRGIEGDDASGLADRITDIAGFLGPAGRAFTALVGVASAAEAFNQFMFSQIDDRFNLVNELRQSGMFTASPEITRDLQSFSQAVADSTFSLAQAADFAQKFSESTAIYGFENAMEYAGSLFVEYAQSFGANADQVINFVGDFLDIQRSLGQLQNMDASRRDRGMENFMQAVTLTSNVMKVSMEEAADILRDAFQDQDLRALTEVLMQGASNQERTAVTSVRATVGGEFGEALSIMMMDQNAFLASSEGQNLMSDPVFAQLYPELQAIANELRGQDPAIIGDILEERLPQLRQFTQGADIQALTVLNQGLARNLVNELITFDSGRFTGAGNTTQTDLAPVDQAEATFIEMRRQNQLGIEAGMTRVIRQYDDLAANLLQQSTATANVNIALQGIFQQFGGVIADASDVAMGGRALAMNTAAGAVDLVISDDTVIRGFTTAGDLMNTAAFTQDRAARNFQRGVEALARGEGWFDSGMFGATETEQLMLSESIARSLGTTDEGQVRLASTALTDEMINRLNQETELSAIRSILMQQSGVAGYEGIAYMSDEDLRAARGTLDANQIAEVQSQLLDDRLDRFRSTQADLLTGISSIFLTDMTQPLTEDRLETLLADSDIFSGDYDPTMIASAMNTVAEEMSRTNLATPESMARLVDLIFERMREEGRDVNSDWHLAGWGDDTGQQNIEEVRQRALQDPQLAVLNQILLHIQQTAQNTSTTATELRRTNVEIGAR